MGTQVDIPSIDANGYGSNEDHALSLAEMICGCPVTADTDKNPFQNRPEDLSENAWYLARSDQISNSGVGFWMLKGEPCQKMFPDLAIICWEINRVFCESNDQETNWMMLEYKITISDGTFSICRIWQDPTTHVQDGRGDLDHSFPIQATGDLADEDIFSGGDFLELRDLEVPLFPSVNSGNLS